MLLTTIFSVNKRGLFSVILWWCKFIKFQKHFVRLNISETGSLEITAIVAWSELVKRKGGCIFHQGNKVKYQRRSTVANFRFLISITL